MLPTLTEAVLCLATTIFFEARDQPLRGQELVAEVVMNRVAHKRFPNKVCKVVKQPQAFSYTHDGRSDNFYEYTLPDDAEARLDAITIAQRYILMEKETKVSSTHYHTTGVSPYWGNIFSVDLVFGDHVFYTCSGYC